MTDVVVVSAFGRGHWAAAEIAKHAMSVTLIDVSESLGRWAPEDWEGPFGWLKAEGAPTSQASFLNEQDYSDEVPSGLSIWLKEGPIDTMGPLQGFWQERRAAYELAKEYIQKFQGASSSDREDMQEGLIDSGFQNNYLAQLAHQLAATIFMPNALGLMGGRPLPLWSPFAIRRVTRKGLQKSLDWCREQSVQVVTNSKIIDVAVDGKNLIGVQVQGEKTEVIGCRQVVWCLSSEETAFTSNQVAEKFFPKGPLLPEWCWMRWRLRGQLNQLSDAVPAHFIVIDDINLSWSHDNLLVVQRCTIDDMFDVWARVPSHNRFQRNYIENMGEHLVGRMNERLPGFSGTLQDQPQEFHYAQPDLGPCLFPIFNLQSRARFEFTSYKNIYYAAAEWLENSDWSGKFEKQSQILQQLIKWKQNEIAKQLKGGRNDQSIQPS